MHKMCIYLDLLCKCFYLNFLCKSLNKKEKENFHLTLLHLLLFSVKSKAVFVSKTMILLRLLKLIFVKINKPRQISDCTGINLFLFAIFIFVKTTNSSVLNLQLYARGDASYAKTNFYFNW